MPPLDPDWHPLASYVIVLAGMALTTWLATRGTRRDVREIKEQTNNSHATNLREDIDQAKAEAREAKEGVHRVERHVVDLTKSIRANEHSLDRRSDLADRALSDAVEDRHREIAELRETIPDLIGDALDQHVIDCPLRRDQDRDWR